jgi:hypothetical protein
MTGVGSLAPTLTKFPQIEDAKKKFKILQFLQISK